MHKRAPVCDTSNIMQFRRQVPSIPVIQTRMPRSKLTRSLALFPKAINAIQSLLESLVPSLRSKKLNRCQALLALTSRTCQNRSNRWAFDFDSLAKSILSFSCPAFGADPGGSLVARMALTVSHVQSATLQGINRPSSLELFMSGLMISSDADDSRESATAVSSYLCVRANLSSVPSWSSPFSRNSSTKALAA
jgi:hypothetical protein